jgi:hypothetical protein
VAVLAARGESLRKTAVREFLESAVNTSEAQGFFHDIDIWKDALRGSLASSHDDPALLFLGVVFQQPSPKLRPVRIF